MKPMTTAIAHPTADRVIVRGFDLSTELIGHVTTAEYFYVLLTGKKPTPLQVAMLDACIVSIAEHGLVPSVQAARMTYASGPEALHGAVAAGLLGSGSVILGSSDNTGRLLAAIVDESRSSGRPIPDVTREHLVKLRQEGKSVPGVGHPLHKVEDPRATALLALAEKSGARGDHSIALDAIVDSMEEIFGRSFPLNVSGVIPAVLLDVDFPARAMKGVPLIGRTMSLMAHILEEDESPIGFGLAIAADHAVTYEGKTPEDA